MSKIKQYAEMYALLLPLLAGLWWGYENILIKDIQSRTKGGLGTEIAEALGVDRSQVKHEFKQMHAYVMDTMPKYHYLADMFRVQLTTSDVGLKVDKLTGQLKYLAIDGLYYQVVKADTGEWAGYYNYRYKDGLLYQCW